MKKYILSVLLVLNISFLFADFSFQSTLNDYYRFEEMSGLKQISLTNFNTQELITPDFNYWNSFSLYRPLLSRNNYSLYIALPQLFSSYNSNYAYGFNDRVAHQGKGFNSSLITGLVFTSSYFNLKLAPEFFISQNSNFDIVPTTSSSGYGDYWTVFDNLQRYGDDPFYLISMGQSVASINLFNTKISVGSENITTGFSKINSFLLSENADGFPHIDIGTDNSLNIKYIGDIEAKMMWGVLTESEFFDSEDSNDNGWISGMFVGVSPFFQKNLMLGFNHLYTKPLSDWSNMDLVIGIPGIDRSNSGTDLKDMMISMAFRWVFPDSNMEIYGEWARNDNWGSTLDILSYPEHTQGYTIGFSSILLNPTPTSVIQMSTEYSNSMQQRTKELRAAGPWYRHSWAGWKQGYTNNGEVLGLGIGPGSESLWAEFKWLKKDGGFYAFTAERIALDKDYSYVLINSQEDLYKAGEIPSDDYYSVPIYINFGLSGLIPLDKFSIYFNGMFTMGYNRNFIEMNQENNIHLEAGITMTY